MTDSLQKTTLRITNLRRAANRDISLTRLLSESLGIAESCLSDIVILRRATDARQERIDVVYTAAVTVDTDRATIAGLLARPDITEHQAPPVTVFSHAARRSKRPVIVGCGPAGLFAALALVERGVPPVVVERGERICGRAATVDLFWRQGLLNPESNVLFGEGGAGTFSDGKLTTRTKSPLKQKVFATLIAMGADSAIAYDNRPHIGTDRLQKIIPALVDELQRRGADFLFETRVSDIVVSDGRVSGLTAGGRHFPADTVFLAVGHSSRDLYRLLLERGCRIEPKGFAVGLRIEHPQEFIDKALLGARSTGPAEYFLSHRDGHSGRGVYAFCMCPGGAVIGCATREHELCTNGMSASRRDSGRANAALVVTVREVDFSGQPPLAGMVFQEQLEKVAFEAGGGGFFAPAQAAADFVAGQPRSMTALPSCSYRPGVQSCSLDTLLPACISEPLKRALVAFDHKISGFIREGLLLGVETRTSAPVRLTRDRRTYHAAGVQGLIPVGEGSGYAGGIVSSAVDGMLGALHFDA